MSPLRVSALGSRVLQAAVGQQHTCAFGADRPLMCWGVNEFGQLGDGTENEHSRPHDVATLGEVTAVAAGFYHSCAIDLDGHLWCWGDNEHGQLGNGRLGADAHRPVEVTALGPRVKGVATGRIHTCAVTTDGKVWCWGSNISGQLGITSMTDQGVPRQVQGLNVAVAQVVAAVDSTCALGTYGSLWCWGSNDALQIGSEKAPRPTSPLPVQVETLGDDVLAVAVGGDHTCAIKGDHTLWCWGYNVGGQLGTGAPSSYEGPLGQVVALGGDVVDVAVGTSFTCALKGDGTLWCWGVPLGAPDYMTVLPEPVQVPGFP